MTTRAALFVVLLALLAAPSAQAYLDPASGSMFLQLLLGGVAAVGVAVKLFWHKILAFFGASAADDEADGDPPPDPSDAPAP